MWGMVRRAMLRRLKHLLEDVAGGLPLLELELGHELVELGVVTQQILRGVEL